MALAQAWLSRAGFRHACAPTPRLAIAPLPARAAHPCCSATPHPAAPLPSRVQGAVQLSAQQLDRVAAARANFLQRIQEVCAERRLIFDRLQAIQVPTTLRAMQQATASWLQVGAGRGAAAAVAVWWWSRVGGRRGSGGRGSQARAQPADPPPPLKSRLLRHQPKHTRSPPSGPQVHEATADLSANMTQEHCVCMSFVRDAFGYVLSPQQARGACGGRGLRRLGGACRGRVCRGWGRASGGGGGLVGHAGACLLFKRGLPWLRSPRRCLLTLLPLLCALPPPPPPTGAQKAVAVVRSYPYFPDMYSIGTAALQAAGSLGAGDDRRLLAARAPAAAGAAATPVAVAVN